MRWMSPVLSTDHGHVVHFADDAQDQFHRYVDAAGARVVVEHHRRDGFAHRAVVLEHLRLVELPVEEIGRTITASAPSRDSANCARRTMLAVIRSETLTMVGTRWATVFG